MGQTWLKNMHQNCQRGCQFSDFSWGEVVLLPNNPGRGSAEIEMLTWGDPIITMVPMCGVVYYSVDKYTNMFVVVARAVKGRVQYMCILYADLLVYKCHFVLARRSPRIRRSTCHGSLEARRD